MASVEKNRAEAKPDIGVFVLDNNMYKNAALRLCRGGGQTVVQVSGNDRGCC
jgi:hypothetical protein